MAALGRQTAVLGRSFTGKGVWALWGSVLLGVGLGSMRGRRRNNLGHPREVQAAGQGVLWRLAERELRRACAREEEREERGKRSRGVPHLDAKL